MKKIASVILCVILCVSFALTAFAGSDDAAVKAATLGLFLELGSGDEGGALEMRGFAASSDGKFLYCGFLQGYRHVTKYNASNGEYISEYEPMIEDDDGNVTADNNYPKGIAVDNRGYLFVGITHANTGYISLACVDANMEEVSYITEKLDTDKTGINGVATQKIGDKILCYVVTCYDKDTIRCYDVTDVNNMKLYTEFGVDGVIDYNELLGSQADPGYIAVDVDGYVYLCYKEDNSAFSKGSTVVKLDTDGKSVVAKEDFGGAYGICTAGDYLFVTTYENENSSVFVINKSDLSQVTQLVYEDQLNPLTGIAYGGGYLYVGDQGDGASISGMVLKSSAFELTRDARETEVVVTDPIETKAPETDPPATEAPVTNAPETNAPETDGNDPATTVAPAATTDGADTADDETKAPAGDKGLNTGALIGIIVGAVVIIGVIVFFVIKSKKK